MSLVSTDLMAASASRNSAGQTSGFAVKFSKKVAARLDITVNPAADVTFFLESSNDNSNWAIVHAMQTVSADIGAALQLFPVHEGYVRVRWTITGGSATFSVKLVRSE